VDRPGANLLDGAAPFYRCYACADARHVAVGALEPPFFAALLDGLGIPRDRYVQHDRVAWPAMQAEFAAVFAARPRDDWAAAFDGTDACVTPVLSLTEAPLHPHNQARATFLRRNGIEQPAPAPRFSAAAGAVGEAGTVTAEQVLRRWRA
jgi:alpha-methylacyl-CoA racemase